MDASTPATTDPSAAHGNLTFWQVVRLSLKGQHFDFTSVPLNRAVILLAVPMVLEMIMESLFAVVDVFWVAHLGSDAIAVIGLTETVMTLIYAVAMGISFAATAIVARRIGEQDPERAAQAAGQIIVIGITLSAGLGLLMSYFAPDVLRLMGASESVIALGTDFA
ncbi:MAG: MATE family efflux transporter, partial [Steroidobacter sp.]